MGIACFSSALMGGMVICATLMTIATPADATSLRSLFVVGKRKGGMKVAPRMVTVHQVIACSSSALMDGMAICAIQMTIVTPAAAISAISVVRQRTGGTKLAPKTATAHQVIACFSCALMGEKTIGVTHTTTARVALAPGGSLATETKSKNVCYILTRELLQREFASNNKVLWEDLHFASFIYVGRPTQFNLQFELFT